MNDRKYALVGSLIMLFGCFAPAMSVPIVGYISIMRGGESLLMLSLAIATVFFAAFRWHIILVITGFFALALNGIVFRHCYMAQIDAELLQMEWGWVVLFLGNALILASPALDEGE